MAALHPVALSIAAYDAELALEAKLLAQGRKSEAALQKLLARSAMGAMDAVLSPTKVFSFARAGWGVVASAAGVGITGAKVGKGRSSGKGRQPLEVAAMLESSGDTGYLPASLQLQVAAIERIVRDAFRPDEALAELVRDHVGGEARRDYLVRAAAGQGPLSLGMLCEFVGILRKRLLAKEPRASSFVKARFQPVVSRHRGEHLPTAALLASQALQRWLQHFRAEYRNPLAHGESIPVTGRSYAHAPPVGPAPPFRGFSRNAPKSSATMGTCRGVSPNTQGDRMSFL